MKKRNFIIIAIVALIGVAFVFNACKSDDTAAPTITLKGTSSMSIVFNDSFTEPGYTATDEKDGDLTSKVTVSGTVNNVLAGDYTLTYKVSDAAGNAATPATRKVTVDAGAFLAGSYSVVDVANNFTTNYSENVTASTTEKNKIYFQKFANYTSALIYGNIVGTTITIPTQTVTCGTPPNDIPHTFSGTGTFTTSKGINITYTDNSTLGNFTNCTGTYTKL